MHVFGEIGVVNNAAPLRSKLANRGMHCMFIGYADNHASGTFKMFNLKTHRIWTTRDVCWVAATIVKYNEMTNNPPMKQADDDDDNDVRPRPGPVTTTHQDDDDEDDDIENDADNDNEADDKDDNDDDKEANDADNNKDDKEETPSTTSKTFHAMKKLASSFNLYAMDYVNHH